MLQPHILVTSQEDRYPWSCHCPTPSHSAGPIPKIHLLTCPPLYPHSTCSRSHLDSAPDSSHPLKPDSDSHHYSQTWQSSPGRQVEQAQPSSSLLPIPARPQPFPLCAKEKGRVLVGPGARLSVQASPHWSQRAESPSAILLGASKEKQDGPGQLPSLSSNKLVLIPAPLLGVRVGRGLCHV